MARIHDLPVEILQCIFILACEIDEAPLDRANDYTLPRGAYLSAIGVRLDRPATSADRLRKPRLKFLAYELRRTCLHWMEVVDSTPELQYIVARVGRPSRNIPEVAKRITENPLVDIDLIFASVYPLPGEDLNKLMDILRPCKSRIRYIEAVGCSFRLCSQIITALNNFEVLPNLQWMELGLNTNVLLSGRVQAMLTVEAPALRHLVLRKVEPVTLNRLDLITNHDRVLFPPNSCGPFLHTTSISTKASYSHILRLRFHLPPDYFLHPLHSETIEFDLPNVHSILLEADSICTIRFLQRIHAPQLKRLVVKRYRGRGGPEDWRLEPVANHLPTLAEILVQGFNTEIFAPFLLRRITSPVLRRVVIGRQTVTKIIGLLEVLCEDPAVGMMAELHKTSTVAPLEADSGGFTLSITHCLNCDIGTLDSLQLSLVTCLSISGIFHCVRRNLEDDTELRPQQFEMPLLRRIHLRSLSDSDSLQAVLMYFRHLLPQITNAALDGSIFMRRIMGELPNVEDLILTINSADDLNSIDELHREADAHMSPSLTSICDSSMSIPLMMSELKHLSVTLSQSLIEKEPGVKHVAVTKLSSLIDCRNKTAVSLKRLTSDFLSDYPLDHTCVSDSTTVCDLRLGT